MKRTSLLAALVVGAAAAACGSSTASTSTQPTSIAVDPATGLRYPDLGPVPPLPDWPNNPDTPAKRTLGAYLFSEVRLSGSGRVACGACHFSLGFFQSSGPRDLPDRSFPAVTPVLPRNTPSLLNVVYAPMMRWDGSHFTDLYDMAVFPLAEANMNLAHSFPADDVHGVDVPGTQAVLKQRLSVDIPGYVPLFQEAFGEDIRTASKEDVWRLAGKAIAVYLRIAVSRDSAFDRWNAGDDAAMDASAQRGLALFRGRAGCIACHNGPFFTDFKFHNVSTAPPDASGKRADEGRYLVTGREEDRGAFLTPTLRSVSLTSPYLHDGSETGLIAVIKRKIGSAGVDPNHDAALDAVATDLSDAELDDIVAFVKALKGKELTNRELALPVTFPQ